MDRKVNNPSDFQFLKEQSMNIRNNEISITYTSAILEECLNDLKTLKIHPWVYKKGITKAIESLKLSNEQKEELRNLRKSR